jgi:hypothetical protein
LHRLGAVAGGETKQEKSGDEAQTHHPTKHK